MEPTTPVQYTDCWQSGNGRRTDFGIDADGRKCERKYHAEYVAVAGGDSVRDGGKDSCSTGKMVAGQWRLV